MLNIILGAKVVCTDGEVGEIRPQQGRRQQDQFLDPLGISASVKRTHEPAEAGTDQGPLFLFFQERDKLGHPLIQRADEVRCNDVREQASQELGFESLAAAK